jgi:hypothetical protein
MSAEGATAPPTCRRCFSVLFREESTMTPAEAPCGRRPTKGCKKWSPVKAVKATYIIFLYCSFLS